MIWDKFEKLGVRERVGLLVAACFLMALVLERLVVRSVAGYCGDLNAEIRTAEANEEVFRATVAMQDGVARNYTAMAGLLARVTTPDEALVDLKGQIDDVARRSGITLISMENRDPVVKGALVEYSVVVGSFEADLKNLVGFLHELQSAPGVLRVTKLTLAPGKIKQAVKGSMHITKLMLPAEG